MPKRNKFEDVFRYIDLNPVAPSTCWLWIGRGLSASGRPYFDCAGKKWIAYRITYWLVHPEWDITNDRSWLLHQCIDELGRNVDNPLCCRPDHLKPGTHEDNMLDMMLRSRSGLTKDVLRAIITLHKEFPEFTHGQLAQRVGYMHKLEIARQTVTDVLNRTRHKKLLDALDEEERKLMDGGKSSGK